MPPLTLKATRERALRRRHPWIFANAVAQAPTVAAGASVEVRGSDGQRYGQGAFSPASQLRVRMWHFEPDRPVDRQFFEQRLEQAQTLRSHCLPAGVDAYRLVNGESDGLPGMIIDHYGTVLVCQFLSAGPEYWRDTLVERLQAQFPQHSLYERSDVEIRQREALPPRSGPLAGPEPPPLVCIQEGDWQFQVDIRQGQKTGFYLDQRDSRRILMAHCDGAEVLNTFCYTGGFTVAALAGGAKHVTALDTSQRALALAQQNVALNGFDTTRVENVAGDAFKGLRALRQAQRQFDVVVLDPPKFLDHKSQLKGASRGYKDINLQALALVRPGGLLFTFSCSGLLEVGLFQKIVADAALDAHREAVIVGRLGQAADHPCHLAFPEGQYLKGLILRVS